jgi:hypothetical protein
MSGLRVVIATIDVAPVLGPQGRGYLTVNNCVTMLGITGWNRLMRYLLIGAMILSGGTLGTTAASAGDGNPFISTPQQNQSGLIGPLDAPSLGQSTLPNLAPLVLIQPPAIQDPPPAVQDPPPSVSRPQATPTHSPTPNKVPIY